jgi:hypothetical protein
MIDDKYQDLMNRAVDETLSPEEQAELDSYLKEHPEARQYYDKLRQVVGVLSELPSAKAPADFKAAVMGSIRSRAGDEVKRERSGLLARLADSFRSGKAWRYTYAFSAGALCGIIVLAAAIYLPNPPSQLDNSNLSATMTSVLPHTTTSIEKQNVSVGDTKGTIDVRRGDGTVVVNGDISSQNETTVELMYDPSDLVPATIWQPEPYRGVISTGKNAIVVRYPGNSRFTIIFRDLSAAASTIACRISSGSETQNLTLATESS